MFNPSAKRYANQEFRKSYEVNEKEKKKQCNERILQVEHRTFTPLVISATGGIGHENRKFYARPSEMISEKRKENYTIIASWLRRKISFASWQIPFVHIYVVVDLFITLQTPTQRIHCLHLQRLPKLRQMLMQLSFPFEFHCMLLLH